MMRKLVALLIMAGASYAIPYEMESKLGPSASVNVPLTDKNGLTSENAPLTPEDVPLVPESVPLTPEGVPLAPESVPLSPEGVPSDPESVPLTPVDVPLVPEIVEDVPVTSEDGLLPDEMSEEGLASKGLKPDGTDLKTDATFWWPSFYRYPYYRHYRPRVYYRYYYW